MSYILLIKSRRRGADASGRRSLPFVSRAEVTTVSIHATRGRALAISPRQSTAVPTLPGGQRGRGRGRARSGGGVGKEGGGVTAFPPFLCRSLPGHLCLPLFFCERHFLAMPSDNL